MDLPPKVPVRMCIGCGVRREQRVLFRFTWIDGRCRFDPERRLGGRGVYICGIPCAKRALDRRSFNRAFRTSVGVVEIETVVRGALGVDLR